MKIVAKQKKNCGSPKAPIRNNYGGFGLLASRVGFEPTNTRVKDIECGSQVRTEDKHLQRMPPYHLAKPQYTTLYLYVKSDVLNIIY